MGRWACPQPGPVTYVHATALLQDAHLSCSCKQSHAHVDHSHALLIVFTGPPCQSALRVSSVAYVLWP